MVFRKNQTFLGELLCMSILFIFFVQMKIEHHDSDLNGCWFDNKSETECYYLAEIHLNLDIYYQQQIQDAVSLIRTNLFLRLFHS